ncbi:hypothetical protein BB560_007209 [Smittium megazygosporum]|uniref:Uncharacterized protein n=1 Tax=Smittium megazygosporum TaxID=133381 RepID=A0A2T9XXW5_9FUNG|nr:hypothetical protein BB560_007209 [Smittium megazygosporum]
MNFFSVFLLLLAILLELSLFACYPYGSDNELHTVSRAPVDFETYVKRDQEMGLGFDGDSFPNLDIDNNDLQTTLTRTNGDESENACSGDQPCDSFMEILKRDEGSPTQTELVTSTEGPGSQGINADGINEPVSDLSSEPSSDEGADQVENIDNVDNGPGENDVNDSGGETEDANSE